MVCSFDHIKISAATFSAVFHKWFPLRSFSVFDCQQKVLNSFLFVSSGYSMVEDGKREKKYVILELKNYHFTEAIFLASFLLIYDRFYTGYKSVDENNKWYFSNRIFSNTEPMIAFKFLI